MYVWTIAHMVKRSVGASTQSDRIKIIVITVLMYLLAFQCLHQQVRHVQEEKAQLEEEKAHMEEELHQQVSSILV